MRKTAFWFIILLFTLPLSLGVVSAQQLPHYEVMILVNRDGVNVRILPALGADVIGFVNAGWTAQANGRSPDNDWVRIDFNGQEGWIGVAVLNLFGDINILPVADPRTIPYGGWDSPRAGLTSAGSPVSGRLADNGVHVRAGPSTAYPVFAEAPRYTIFPLTGRTANNAWLQVNFEGTLGWVSTQYVTLLDNTNVTQLPIDGIVAESIPFSQPTQEDYLGTLQFMLDRVNLAQPSLDAIRATWTNVALGSRSACGPFPARPSDMNIPQALLAAFYGTLNPLLNDFNVAMANVRLPIDLWIEACHRNQPDPGVVGIATVQGALSAIEAADAQFADLRRRLDELLPDLTQLGPNQCAFSFNGATDILQVLQVNKIYIDQLTAEKTATGYCFDANAGQRLFLETLQIAPSNIVHFIATSPFDNPTAFLGTGSGVLGTNLLSVGPVVIPATGRYLLIVTDRGGDVREEPPQGTFAVFIRDADVLANFADPAIVIDLATGQPTGQYNIAELVPVGAPGTAITPGVPTPGGVVSCPSTAFTCEQLLSCAEAQACLSAGNFSLDSDSDGIPCEETLCT
jgi:uncharacterized protein YraI